MIIFVSLVWLFANVPSYGSSYEGKTITIIVGYKPGGGYDRYARLIGKHLPKHIPGKPGVIIQNMPGASSVIAANHLYSIAKPDGLTIGTFNARHDSDSPRIPEAICHIPAGRSGFPKFKQSETPIGAAPTEVTFLYASETDSAAP